jgi:hypothetical protein
MACMLTAARVNIIACSWFMLNGRLGLLLGVVVLRTNWEQEVNLAVARSEAQKRKKAIRQELEALECEERPLLEEENEGRPLIGDEASE